jgi:glucose-6-phosphate isomerase
MDTHSHDNEQLIYDFTFMMDEVVGEYGATEAELQELQPRMVEINDHFLKQKDNNEVGFAELPYDTQTLAQVQDLANRIRSDFSTLVVLGIGGSDLGARAVHSALNHTYFNELALLRERNSKHDNQSIATETRNPSPETRLYFAGDNTDPRALADLVDVLDFEHTAINVIYKSGDTIETMSAFVYLRQKLAEAVGEEQVAEHIVATTDASKGSLYAIAEREGYTRLVVPDTVGGRFSVLSTVGLFPLAYAGVNIEQLLAGAFEMDERLSVTPAEKNPAMMFAALHYLGNTKRQQNISVMMPYASGLRGIGQWYRQLWAESLGKAVNLEGKEVYVGQTPVAAVGATDQHSQVQLYMEGPFDKLVTLVTVDDTERSVLLADGFEGLPELSYLEGVELNEILLGEGQSTAMALAHNKRPNGTIRLPRLNEFYVGQLLYLLEVACAFSGELYGIDAYNQPGVELGKQLMYAQLGREGFADKWEELKHLANPKKKYVV